MQTKQQTARRSLAGIALAAGALLALPATVHAQAVAVVVHSENPVSDISTRELARIFLGQSNTFAGIGRIRRFEHEGVRERFYRAVASQSLSQIDRQWNQLVFSGSGAERPVHSPSLSSVMRSVAETPGGIAIVPAEEANAMVVRLALQGLFVKIVTVGGFGPGDAAYPIK